VKANNCIVAQGSVGTEHANVAQNLVELVADYSEDKEMRNPFLQILFLNYIYLILDS
jgi:hypothetical protein